MYTCISFQNLEIEGLFVAQSQLNLVQDISVLFFSLSEVGPYYYAITILSINLYLTVVVENLTRQTEKID